MRVRLILFLMLLPMLGPSVQAGIFFNRKPKPAPKQPVQVPQLVQTLRNDRDEDRRLWAIEQLRQFDPAQHPSIVPALIELLQHDRRSVVRSEAAYSLGRVRPVSPLVGRALEDSLSRDSSMRVRIQARSSLLQYQLAGYRSSSRGSQAPPATNPPARGPSTKQPPLADPRSPPPVRTNPYGPGGVGSPSYPGVPAGRYDPQPLPAGPAVIPVPSTSGPPRVPETAEPPTAPPPSDGPSLGSPD